MKLTLFLLLLLSFTSYAQNTKHNSITITNDSYAFNLQGVTSTFKTTAQLSNYLQKVKSRITKDTLNIYLSSTIPDRVTPISGVLRNLKIKKYQYIVTDNLFELPYPKDSTITQED